MAANERTADLLHELEVLDRREDRILDVLLARGARLEEAERRGRSLTLGELEELAHGLTGLETVIAGLRARLARSKTVSTNGSVHHHVATHPRPPDLAAAIRAAGGRYGEQIIRAARLSRLPVPLVCAVIQQETGFRNVFGHDRVANPVKSPTGGLLAVTRERYVEYLRHRRLQGNQGVGPMQITNTHSQDRADRLGGCWRPGPNIRAGCELLADNIGRLGLRAGVQAYNGAPGFAYADSVLALERTWRARLAGAHPAAGGARTLRLADPLMKGDDVRRLQQDLNRRLAALRVDEHVMEDGEFGPETRHAARQVAYALGVASSDWAGGMTPALQGLIRTPSRRTPEQLAAARQRRGWLARLRKRHTGPLRMRAYREAKRLLDMHVHESGGNNRGRMVARIILANHGTVGEPWCGDFIAWCYRRAGSTSVTRAWAGVKAYLPLTGLKRVGAPLKGDLVRYSFDHIGLFVGWCDAGGREVGRKQATHVKAIEGNTGRAGALSDSAGGGDGVYLKLRSRALVSDFIRVLR